MVGRICREVGPGVALLARVRLERPEIRRGATA